MAKKEHTFSCPIGGTLDIIAGRWKPEILWHLRDNPTRFNQLRRAIGSVSQKMLAQQLRELERDGLIKRTQFEEIPPRVEYERTDLANSLEPIFLALTKWSDAHRSTVLKAQKKYDSKKK